MRPGEKTLTGYGVLFIGGAHILEARVYAQLTF